VLGGYLNDAQYELTEDVIAIYSFGASYTMPRVSQFVAITNFVDSINANRLFKAIRDCNVNGIAVENSGYEQLQTGVAPYLTRPGAQPSYYFTVSNAIGFSQIQNAGTTITVNGFCTAAPMDTGNLTSTMDVGITDDWAYVLELYACWRACEQQVDNENLAPRVAEFMRDYLDAKLRIAQLFVSDSPDVARGFFPKAIQLVNAAGGRVAAIEGRNA
jgi:hypothetical protein